MYFLVSCPSLTDPSNGMMSCSLGDDEAPSYEDTCSFKCDTGYELTGSETRTCQSDGSWSGSDVMCSKSEWFLMCMLLVATVYGKTFEGENFRGFCGFSPNRECFTTNS